MKCIMSTLMAALILAGNIPLAAQAVRSNDYWMKYTSKLPIGSVVNVRTTDGKRTSGILAIVDDTGHVDRRAKQLRLIGDGDEREKPAVAQSPHADTIHVELMAGNNGSIRATPCGLTLATKSPAT